jgi:hypothetical protein
MLAVSLLAGSHRQRTRLQRDSRLLAPTRSEVATHTKVGYPIHQDRQLPFEMVGQQHRRRPRVNSAVEPHHKRSVQRQPRRSIHAQRPPQHDSPAFEGNVPPMRHAVRSIVSSPEIPTHGIIATIRQEWAGRLPGGHVWRALACRCPSRQRATPGSRPSTGRSRGERAGSGLDAHPAPSVSAAMC